MPNEKPLSDEELKAVRQQLRRADAARNREAEALARKLTHEIRGKYGYS